MNNSIKKNFVPIFPEKTQSTFFAFILHGQLHSPRANALLKSMNPSFLPHIPSRILGQTELFRFDTATSLGEGKL